MYVRVLYVRGYVCYVVIGGDVNRGLISDHG